MTPDGESAEPEDSAPPPGQLIFKAPIVRRRRARGAVVFSMEEPSPTAAIDRRPSRAAQMLALAHELQRLIDAGEVADRAELAELVGFTRARLTQLLDLLLLAPDIQEEVLLGAGPRIARPVAERQLRRITRHSAWQDQRFAWGTPRLKGAAVPENL